MATDLTTLPQEGEIFVRRPDSPEGLLALAIEHGISVEGIRQLMEMAKEVRAERARADFLAAMTNFQNECPVIQKKQSGYGYKYANIEDIHDVITPILTRHGLSHRANTRQEETPRGLEFVVTTLISHENGHTEPSEFRVPIGGGKNAERQSGAQQVGTSNTYARRYGLVNALGLVVGDEDNDAAPARKEEAHNGASHPAKPAPTTANAAPPQQPRTAPPTDQADEIAIAHWDSELHHPDLNLDKLNAMLPAYFELFTSHRSVYDAVGKVMKELAGKWDLVWVKNRKIWAQKPQPAAQPPTQHQSDTNGNAPDDGGIPF